LCIEHAKRRVQFGQPLAKFGLIQDKIARIAAFAYAMEATAYLVANAFDAGEEDIMLESALLKVFVSDEVWTIVNETIQLHGGMAFFCDQPFERMMRDSRLNSIGEGANEVMRCFIAGTALADVGRDLQAALKNPAKLMGLVGKSVVGSASVPVKSPHLQQEARWLGQTTRRLGRSALWLLGKHREGIINQQHQLDRLTTIAIAIYTVTAVVSKLDSDLAVGKAPAGDLQAGKLYCQYARQRALRALAAIKEDASIDQGVRELSKTLTGL
jgi:alkylation response protein AidB-like acyl-CoA dehydrogenase